MIKSRHINKIRSIEIAALNGPSSQDVRLEWVTISGGTYNAPNDVYVEATKSVNILDVRAIWGPESDDEEKSSLDENKMEINQNGYWYFSKTLDLSNTPELVILHKVKDTYYKAAGTTLADVWTPNTAPTWSVNQWQGYWLVFPDSRFKILNNDTTSITVDLDGGALPVGSNIGEILRLVVWNPIRDDLSVPGGVTSPLGGELTFQSIYSSRQDLIG